MQLLHVLRLLLFEEYQFRYQLKYCLKRDIGGAGGAGMTYVLCVEWYVNSC